MTIAEQLNNARSTIAVFGDNIRDSMEICSCVSSRLTDITLREAMLDERDGVSLGLRVEGVTCPICGGIHAVYPKLPEIKFNTEVDSDLQEFSARGYTPSMKTAAPLLHSDDFTREYGFYFI